MLSLENIELALDFLLDEIEVVDDPLRFANDVEKSLEWGNALVSSKLFTLEESYSLFAPAQAEGVSVSSSMLTIVDSVLLPQFR